MGFRLSSLASISSIGFALLYPACGGSNAGDLVGPATDQDAATTTPDGATPVNDGSTTGDGAVGGDSATDAATDAPCIDGDGDGVTTCQGDCDDTDPNNFPNNIEYCGDAKDNNCSGQADENCNGKGTYVSGATGDDNNAGTQAKPLKTIKKGLANAKSIGGKQIVFVAAAHYPEDVDMSEGISLWGGYACTASSCTWARDPKANDTAILNQRPNGVVADDTITSATTISGFRIQGQNVSGGGTLDTRGITCSGGSPTITNNTINGGTVTVGSGNRTVAVYVGAPTNNQTTGAIIDKNVIKGGDASGSNSYGVLVARPSATNPAIAQITSNTITGGSSSVGVTYALLLNGSAAATRVFDNDITAGDGGSTSRTYGIRLASPATIDKNRINVDQNSVGTCTSAGAEFCGGGIQLASTAATITNNVVLGVKGNVTAALSLSTPEGGAPVDAVINGNYFDGAGIGAGIATASAAVSLRIGGGNNGVVGRLRNNILMGGGNKDRYGVYEEHVFGKTCHPEAFDHNDIFFSTLGGTTDVVYHFDDGSAGSGTDRTFSQMQASAIGSFTPANNLNADCLVSATFHLGASSVCGNAGVATEAPAKDIDGDSRPIGAAVDIGPDEAQ
jgi:hypothetical protein